ncbi:Phosphatidic acid phosphatase type 2/haloperoxidase [Pseudocohnilembus persalinus]|uniref:Phosphatidic acid phosphatase type 2/haloperoxidase n=1 Tax=Pseudocohnilembus persalinus TaxID=266149 RepID=A0A0V0Q852_PSEPJ|nr:Phosphatidic acid phosphatase type 2/haloperoxidase [Pseudocohnilembus persalinus]|eukprot:KRW98228.1 Phosphatidic acid phosphatase type 2/haloperoxidase [Pseudocohnilembus persalinus]
MARNSIKAYECAVEFGNPSGHAMMSALCFTIFPYAVDNDFYRFKNKMGKISLTKIFICIFNFIYIGLIMVARISVGVHSLNQVILGFTYGILFSAIYVEFMNGYLNSYISYINQIEKRHKIKYVAYVNLIYIVFIGSLFGIFYLSKSNQWFNFYKLVYYYENQINSFISQIQQVINQNNKQLQKYKAKVFVQNIRIRLYNKYKIHQAFFITNVLQIQE